MIDTYQHLVYGISIAVANYALYGVSRWHWCGYTVVYTYPIAVGLQRQCLPTGKHPTVGCIDTRFEFYTIAYAHYIGYEMKLAITLKSYGKHLVVLLNSRQHANGGKLLYLESYTIVV